MDWHLEFTTSKYNAKHTFDEDDLLVFYPSDQKEYLQIIKNIQQQNIPQHTPKNPYWSKNGILIQDPDGYHVIISHLKT